MANTWNSTLYDSAHSFVWKLAADMVPMLNPQAGEQIIDLGCGTGHLTAEIARAGAKVVGIDSSEQMVEQAKAAYPEIEFRTGDARSFAMEQPVDAVFSNATLHWVTEAEAAVACIARSLKPGGRFVAEFGGKGNTRRLLAGAIAVLKRHGVDGRNPWYYPSIAEYSSILESHGLEVRQAHLFDRKTTLESSGDAMAKWLRMFGGPLLAAIPADEREAVIAEIAEEVRPSLQEAGQWYMDYRRIRVLAVKTNRE